MMRLVEKQTAVGQTIYSVLGVAGGGASDSVKVSNLIGEFCREVVAILAITSHKARVCGSLLACVDEGGVSNVPDPRQISTNIVIFAEWEDFEGRRLGLFARIMFALHRSAVAQLMENGVPEYQQWFLRKFLTGWSDATKPLEGDEAHWLLTDLKTWVFGTPNRQFRIDLNGIVVPADLPSPIDELTFGRQIE